MSKHRKQLDEGYAAVYAHFDTPLVQKVRAEAFEEDIGQHSWVTASELREYLSWLRLLPNQRVLDYGCGPGGPLSYMARHTGAHATGIDINPTALQSARRRVSSMDLAERVDLRQVDADGPLPFADASFDAALSIDVVMHLVDRGEALKEVCRVLKQDGLFLFTDAGVVNGQISNEQIRVRSHYGFSQYVPCGYTEAVLEASGFKLEKREVRNVGPVTICAGRLKAREKYKQELVRGLGKTAYEHEQAYLATMVDLYSTRTLLRYVYLARKRGVPDEHS